MHFSVSRCQEQVRGVSWTLNIEQEQESKCLLPMREKKSLQARLPKGWAAEFCALPSQFYGLHISLDSRQWIESSLSDSVRTASWRKRVRWRVYARESMRMQPTGNGKIMACVDGEFAKSRYVNYIFAEVSLWIFSRMERLRRRNAS